MPHIVRRRYTSTDPQQLLDAVARINSVGFQSITITPGEIVAELFEEPPVDPNLRDFLADDDMISIPATSRTEVLDLLWRHCNRLRLVPFRCVLVGRSSAEWLGMDMRAQTIWGIPVRSDASVDMDAGEFMFLLADNYYGPIKHVQKVIHGRVGEG